MKLVVSIELKEVMKKPVDELNEDDLEVIEKEKEKLPPKAVKLGKDESMIDPGTNARPLKYLVKKGDTLKSIAEKFCVSYGELSNHLMNTQGTTSIHKGMELRIPRHFIDLTRAE